jgi:hypothetical protein
VVAIGIEPRTYAASLDSKIKKIGSSWNRTRVSAATIRCLTAVPLELMKMEEKLQNKYPPVLAAH